MYIWTKVEDDCTCKVRGPFETEGDCLEDLKHYLKIETSYFIDYFSIKVRELDSLPFSDIEQAFLGTGITFQIHELTDPTPKKSMESNLKQVIIVRTHYPDKNGGTRTVRTGKLIAQAGHAVLGCFNPVLHGFDELTLAEEEWLDGD